jgi:hypothetical protein
MDNFFKKLFIEQELKRLNNQLEKHQIIYDGIENYCITSDKEVTVREQNQLYTAAKNVLTYQNLVADKETELLLCELNLKVK